MGVSVPRGTFHVRYRRRLGPLYFGARMAHQAFGQAGGKLRELWDESSFYVGNRPKVVVQDLEVKILPYYLRRALKAGQCHEPDFGVG